MYSPRATLAGRRLRWAEPVVFPDLGLWHPLAAGMFEDLKEYLNWNSSRADLSEKAKAGPVIGLVLQRSHIVTGDEAHYVAVDPGTGISRRHRDSGVLRRARFLQARQGFLLRPARSRPAAGGWGGEPHRLRLDRWPGPARTIPRPSRPSRS